MCVLVDDKPVKELANGTVQIPYGPYKLRFRNKNTRRALVKFTIDDENVSGNGYIIPPNSYIDIERWSDKPCKFQFVPLDSPEAVDHGKNGPNPDKVKGTIRADFYLERQFIVRPVETPEISWSKPTPWRRPYRPRHRVPDSVVWRTKSIGDFHDTPDCTLGGVTSNSFSEKSGYTLGSPGTSRSFASQEAQDGCTVEGSYSTQQFTTTSFDAEPGCVTLRLFLQGYDPESRVDSLDAEQAELKKRQSQLRELEEQHRRLQYELTERERLRKQQEELDAKIAALLEKNKQLAEQLQK